MKQLQLLPEVQLEIDGRPADATLRRSLTEFRVQQRLSLPSVAEIVFRDPPGPLDALRNVAIGDRLRLDTEHSGVALIDGDITAIEHAFSADGQREVRLRAYDPSHRLRKRQPVRAHIGASAASVATELASECDLELQTAHDGPVWPRVIQYDRSDFDLLQHMLERAGLYFTVRQKVMHLMSLTGIGPAVRLAFGEELIETRMELNADPACRTVDAAGWNPLGADAHVGRATDPRVGREVRAMASPDSIGSDGTRNLAGVEVLDGDHAKALAQAELDRRVGREVTLWALATGDPRLRPGAWVDITAPTQLFAGRHLVTEATHTLDERRGFLTEVSTAIPPPRDTVAPMRTTLGVIVDVADPDGLGRVRVRLPGIADLETDWLEVLLPAVGEGKGIIALPAPDDRVLVLLGGPEASQAIVLGGLYGDTVPPDSGVDGERVVRYTLATPSGQRVILAHDARTLTLEDGNGNRMQLGPDAIRIDAVVDVQVVAPGRRMLFQAAAIDFERA